MRRQLRLWILLADLLWISMAYLLTYRVHFGFYWYDLPEAGWHPVYLFVLITTLALWAVLYFRMKLDGFSEGWDVPSMCSRVAGAVLLCLSFLATLCFFQKQYYSRLFQVGFAALLLLGLILIRVCFRWFIAVRRRAGASRRIVILGYGRIVREVADKISQHPELMWEVIGFLYPSDVEAENGPTDLAKDRTSAQTLEVLELLQKWRAQELIAILPQLGVEAHKLIERCRKAGMTVSIVPQSNELYVSKIKLQEIGGVPLLSLQERDARPAALFVRRTMDLVLGTVLLVIVSPFLVSAAIALYWRKHRVFVAVDRCGKDGWPFRMYRLNVNRDDPGMRGYERLLSRLSLTELPQLFNVLCGEMSIVGPRPESPERVKHYSDWQRQRVTVKPGLTGLAQVHGLREQHSSEEKSKFDMQYILNWSPFGDLALFLQTAWTLAIRLSRREPTSIDGKVENARRPTIAFQGNPNVDRA